ncbi:MAG: hypothetical protein K6C69_04200 [Lachnospiraceae bacterium]|nr:hypothetical protein [Lachnospiraceae bacterium]
MKEENVEGNAQKAEESETKAEESVTKAEESVTKEEENVTKAEDLSQTQEIRLWLHENTKGAPVEHYLSKQEKKEQVYNILSVVGLFCAFLMVVLAGYVFFHFHPNVQVEIGEEFQLSSVWTGVSYAELLPEGEVVDCNTLGVYHPRVLVAGLVPVYITVQVVDTTPPRLETKALSITYRQEVTPEEFVAKCEDMTEVTLTFLEEPDTARRGQQTVTIQATDVVGNVTEKTANMTMYPIRSELTCEMGSCIPEATTLVVGDAGKAYYVSLVSTMTCGDFPVKVQYAGKVFEVMVHVVDTTPPKVVTQSLEGFIDHPLEADAFIESVQDYSEVEFSFAEEVDWTEEGERQVKILCADAEGNEIVKIARLTLSEDTLAPVFGATWVTVTEGDRVSYREALRITDNADAVEDITLEILESNVDLNSIGRYTALMKATDTVGNSREVRVSVRVLGENGAAYNEASIQREVDEIYGAIISAGMSDRQKAQAIYNWVHNRIKYGGHTVKGDYWGAAYSALDRRYTDCYGYAVACDLLLKKAGIPTQMIVKQITPATSQVDHYWNLIFLDNGWYHYDATRRRDGATFCIVTDAQLMYYSATHEGSHNYDPSRYPTIQ